MILNIQTIDCGVAHTENTYASLIVAIKKYLGLNKIIISSKITG